MRLSRGLVGIELRLSSVRVEIRVRPKLLEAPWSTLLAMLD